jgi:CrcB protein
VIYLWVGLGSALGGAARYWCYGVVARHLAGTFPWGTLAVNLIGSAFIGFFAALTSTDGRLLVPSSTRQFVMAGLCGGFTTYSTFSLETLQLARDGDFLRAFGNIIGTLSLCLAGVWLGYVLATAFNET